jgi:hypothetical protein
LTLLVLFVSAQESYFLVDLLLPKGHPQSRRNRYDWALGAVPFIYVFGMVWAAKTMGIL